MKAPKMLLASIALCMSLAAFSQTDTTTKKDTTTRKKDTANIQQPSIEAIVQPSTTGDSQQSQNNNQQSPSSSATPQQSQSITSSEAAQKPNFGRYYIPVLGSYQSSQTTDANKSVTITPDESNPGKIWVEGLTESKFYALLKAVPGTYKVPAQNLEDKNVQEGTVIYDDGNKQINICLGCGYKDNNPSDALSTGSADGTSTDVTTTTTTKSKTKSIATKSVSKSVITFSGTKAEQKTALNNK